MPANVETMFYVREKPWHGLGTEVQEAPTSADALIYAGLDWEVIQKDVYTEGGILVPGYKANLRSTDNAPLGIVSDRYKVVQNEDAFQFTDDLPGAGVTYETAGALQGGRKVWMLARMPHRYIIAGDEIAPSARSIPIKHSIAALRSRRQAEWRSIMDNTKLKGRMSGKVQELQQSTGDQSITVTSAADASLAPVDSTYLALSNNALDIIRANLKSQPLTLDLFDIVKSPSGGSTVFEVPGLTGNEAEKSWLASFWTTPRPGPIGTPPTRWRVHLLSVSARTASFPCWFVSML